MLREHRIWQGGNRELARPRRWHWYKCDAGEDGFVYAACGRKVKAYSAKGKYLERGAIFSGRPVDKRCRRCHALLVEWELSKKERVK